MDNNSLTLLEKDKRLNVEKVKNTFSQCLKVIAASSVILCGAEAVAKDWKTPKTADGHPDFQGFWTNATITPLEREAKYGDRIALSEKEVAEIEGADAEFREKELEPTDPSLTVEDLPEDCGGGFTGVDCGYNNFWVDPGTKIMRIDGEPRASMITNPKNGRVPPLLPAGRARLAKMYASYVSGDNAGPEARALGERCLMSFGSSAGPPMIPLLYNNNYQIVQNKDHVMILVEMVHDVRIIPLTKQRRPAVMAPWMGDSIGRFEGDTLVVETMNVNPNQSFRGSGPNAKFIERFTRTGESTIKYEFTVEDPESFSQTWGGQVAFNSSDKPLYEYACHEGNYSLPGILAGTRKKERDAAEAAKKK